MCKGYMAPVFLLFFFFVMGHCSFVSAAPSVMLYDNGNDDYMYIYESNNGIVEAGVIIY